MGLTTARWSIEEEGVEGRLARMLSDSEADGTGQLVRGALNKRVERLVYVTTRYFNRMLVLKLFVSAQYIRRT